MFARKEEETPPEQQGDLPEPLRRDWAIRSMTAVSEDSETGKGQRVLLGEAEAPPDRMEPEAPEAMPEQETTPEPLEEQETPEMFQGDQPEEVGMEEPAHQVNLAAVVVVAAETIWPEEPAGTTEPEEVEENTEREREKPVRLLSPTIRQAGQRIFWNFYDI